MLTERPTHRTRLLLIATTSVLVVLAYGITYATGGTRYAFAHVGYLPVLFGAMVFGLRGGVIVGLLTGVCLGPAMPLDTEFGLSQPVYNWLTRTIFFVSFGLIVGMMISVVSEQFRRLRQVACLDPVTGLPNGWVFFQALNRLFELERRPALCCLYLDHPTYEDVLLTLGSREADELAAKLARALSGALPADTTLYHMRGCRFATFLASADRDEAIATAHKLVAAGLEPIEVAGIPIAVNSHFGVAPISPDTADSWSLARQAAAALEHAVQRGMAFATYDQVKTDREPDALMILGELRKALADGEGLYLAFQPKIEVASGRCVGVEALIRWDHKVMGRIPPARFVPVVEKTAMTQELTRWVVATAIRQCAEWARAGLDLSIAVNISARDLETRGFPAFVRDTLERYQVHPRRLELELTETAVMGDPTDNLAALTALAEMGLLIAIDDFGTGYSSLERLRDLPAKMLKIDQSFVRDLAEGGSDDLIVRGSIALAHGLGMKVVAEGVESDTAYDMLKAFGCDYVQGYLFARPLCDTELRAWLVRGERSLSRSRNLEHAVPV